MSSVDPSVVALVRTVADLLTRWADAHTRPPEQSEHPATFVTPDNTSTSGA